MELLIFFVGFGASFIASMSGGSASLLTIPVWLALGYPLPAAIGSEKVSGTFWTLAAARNYLRRETIDRPLLIAMGLVGFGGAIGGASVVSRGDPAAMKSVVSLILLCLVVIVGAMPRYGLATSVPRIGKIGLVTASLFLGFYEGFLGSGNSILSTVVLCLGGGYQFITALGTYYLLASLWCATAATTYGLGGFLIPRLVIPSLLGGALGGHCGSKLGKARGNQFVRKAFLIVATGNLLYLVATSLHRP